MTDHIPLPPPDHTEDVPGFVHDTQRHYYSEETLRAHAERLHATRANGPAIMQAIGLLAVLQSWIGPRRPEGSEPEGRALWDQIEATRTALMPIMPAHPPAAATPQLIEPWGYAVGGHAGVWTGRWVRNFAATDKDKADGKALYEAAAPAAQGDAQALNEIADIFHIGSEARKDRSCILTNVRNTFRRSQCLSRIEHGYFTVPRPPAEWDNEDEGGEECLLNWGDEPDEYTKRFGEALAQIAAPAAQGEPRWYMVNKSGVATLCADHKDAEREAATAQEQWPKCGPHRAVQLIEVGGTPPEGGDAA